MKLLILTQYYPPETGAPQNRLHELAVRLKLKGVEVQVLTALPNYPKMEVFETYKKKNKREETIDGIKVFRSWIYVSKSKSIIARLLNYFSFVFSSYIRGRRLGNYDYLMVESPPLFLGYSAIALAKRTKAKLIFNVSDLWPESAEKLEIVNNKRLLKMAYNLEAKCYKKAFLITGQTQGIVKDIKSRFSEKMVHWLPNGVDTDYYNPQLKKPSTFRQSNGIKDQDLVFLYAGIIGHAQGLEIILNAAKSFLEEKQIKFVILGDGPVRETLLQMKKESKLSNVLFLNSVSKSEMPNIVSGCDVALVPLKKLDLFLGAIPSKVFENLSMQKPVLLGVDGEARELFINQGKAGWYYEPENLQELIFKIREIKKSPEEILKRGMNGRGYVKQFFERDVIAGKFHSILNKKLNKA
ncbi:MAG: glycosyltransferase family 4 protein [Crocinitomicaceae bacterium]|nr:glycosyltransferase family 4 protein [Crocinitomicaceae bacterium]